MQREGDNGPVPMVTTASHALPMPMQTVRKQPLAFPCGQLGVSRRTADGGGGKKTTSGKKPWVTGWMNESRESVISGETLQTRGWILSQQRFHCSQKKVTPIHTSYGSSSTFPAPGLLSTPLGYQSEVSGKIPINFNRLWIGRLAGKLASVPLRWQEIMPLSLANVSLRLRPVLRGRSAVICVPVLC